MVPQRAVPIATKIPDAEVVRHDQQNIGFPGIGGFELAGPQKPANSEQSRPAGPGQKRKGPA